MAKRRAASPATGFRSFEPSLVQFLEELALNNNREWFADNKSRYESLVMEPAFAFIEAMAPRLFAISPHFLAIAKRSGGSLMRVYKDTRFSRDKAPYKTNVGIQFRHELGKDVHAPGFYFHIEPGSVFLGAGMWRPDAGALGAIRDRIVEQPKRWAAARDAVIGRGGFEFHGQQLKRAPRGYPADHPQVDDLKRKDFIAVRNLDPGVLYESNVVDVIGDTFAGTDEFVGFLCKAIDVPY